jgi:hypothetical protein
MRPTIIGSVLPAIRYISERDPNTKRYVMFGVPLVELFRYKPHLITCKIKPYGATFATHDPYRITVHNLDFAIAQNFRMYHLMRLDEATAWKSDLVVFDGEQFAQIEKVIRASSEAVKKLQ